MPERTRSQSKEVILSESEPRLIRVSPDDFAAELNVLSIERISLFVLSAEQWPNKPLDIVLDCCIFTHASAAPGALELPAPRLIAGGEPGHPIRLRAVIARPPWGVPSTWNLREILISELFVTLPPIPPWVPEECTFRVDRRKSYARGLPFAGNAHSNAHPNFRT